MQSGRIPYHYKYIITFHTKILSHQQRTVIFSLPERFSDGSKPPPKVRPRLGPTLLIKMTIIPFVKVHLVAQCIVAELPTISKHATGTSAVLPKPPYQKSRPPRSDRLFRPLSNLPPSPGPPWLVGMANGSRRCIADLDSFPPRASSRGGDVF